MSNLDRAQVEALWVQHAAGVRHFVLGVVRDGEVADEVLQQTFVTLLERGEQAGEASRKGWIYRVAFRHALGHKRRAKAAGRALDTVKEATRRRPSHATSAVDAAMRSEARRRTRAAIATLPADQRHVVEQRLAGGKTFAEIARELDIPLNTALTRMRLAMQKLRKELSDDDE